MGVEEQVVEDRFEVLELVGEGAFGEVLRARDRRTGADVAIKRLREDAADPNRGARFLREARYLARVESPHVVRYVAHGPDARGRPCIALEWLEGADLAHLLRRERLSVALALEITRQAALGLAGLHAAGIVHRDVKPANFFLVRDDAAPATAVPHVKLVNLGIARADDEAPLTVRGARLGTPMYMSPEQARGDERVGAASDVFSLGIVLYELLTGRRPFAADRTLIVVAKIVLHDPPPIAEVRPNLPPEVSALVGRALAKKPEARFESALALARTIEDVALALAGRAYPRLGSPDAPAWAAPVETPRPPQASEQGPLSAPPSAPPSAPLSSSSEQRVVTAVFASFAALPAPDAAEAAFVRLSAERGGACYATLGHQVIAVFGGAQTLGDEALRGARLSLLARRALPSVRLGVVTARARIGQAGLSEGAIERGVVRPAAAGDAIVLDEPTARLIGERLAVEELPGGGFALRGERFTMPMAAPRLLGRETPLVGRETELSMLEALYDRCIQGPRARMALVVGPAGSGKSRVRYELLRRLAALSPRPLLLGGQGESLRKGSPFAMIGDVVRRAFGLGEGEPPKLLRERLASGLAAVVPAVDVGRLTDFLGELAQIPPGAEESPLLRLSREDPILMGDAKRMAFEDWIVSLCRRGPVVLLLEDLHWGDLPTLKLALSLLGVARHLPLFILLLARPEVTEDFPALAREQAVETFHLPPLPRGACERLAREVLGSRAEPLLIRRIADRADGNAFYLEEMIRAAAAGQEGLPDSVLGMVQARLDALGPAGKRVLRAASIFGERATQAGVLALCGGGEEAIEELLSREVLVQRADPAVEDRVELAFRHTLVREAAYAMLPPEERVRGHRAAAAWLEAAGEADPLALATHHERGEQPERAIGLWLRAAEQALGGNDFTAAHERAARGVQAAAKGETLGLLRLVQAEACRWRGDTDEAIAAAREAASLLPRGSRSYYRAVGEIVVAAGRRGLWDEVERFLDQAAWSRAAEGAESDQTACLCPGASLLLQAGRSEAGLSLVERIDEIVRAARSLDPMARARRAQLRAFLAGRDGDLGAARLGHVEAMSLFEAMGIARGACLERVNLGFVCTELGDFERAEAVLRECLATAGRLSLRTVQSYALINLSRVLMDLGRAEEAEGMALWAQQEAGSTGGVRLLGAALIQRAMLAHVRADFPAAEALARQAEATLSALPPMAAGAMAVRARSLLGLRRTGEALGTAAAAMGAVESGQNEMFHALVRLSYAEALFTAGKREEARAAIGAARAELWRAARKIGDPELSRSFLERVRVNARTMALAAAWGGA